MLAERCWKRFARYSVCVRELHIPPESDSDIWLLCLRIQHQQHTQSNPFPRLRTLVSFSPALDDRLKIFLITRPPDLGGTGATGAPVQGLKAIAGAVSRIFAEGGVRAFWVGNGLSVMKIFPESAIKFFSYESSVSRREYCVMGVVLIHVQKRFFAKYVDHVEDPRDISGSSRFISGGMGGITSQLSA